VADRSRGALTADDAEILALESPTILGHTLKVIRLASTPRRLGAAELAEHVEARLDSVPRARERIEGPADDRAAPRWVEDDDFDIHAHVAERPPLVRGDREELWAAAAEIMAERLDHRRPLWALDLVGPLRDGGVAIVARFHHAMADGVGCVRLLEGLLWDRLEAPATTAPPAHRSAAESAQGGLRELAELPGALWRELAGHAPKSPLDRRIGSARALAFLTVPLADLKAIGGSRPGHVTVNDVLLAAIAGGLRAWLADRFATRLPKLRAQVPVSLHHRDADPAAIGNRDSFLNIDLPLAEPDPIRRLEAIHAETARRKRLGDAEELYDFFHALGRVPRAERSTRRLISGPGEFSLAVSNVPGPGTEVAVAGRTVDSLASVAEPADRHALRISAISSAGRMTVGLCTDPAAVPGVEGLAVAIEDAVAVLHTTTRRAEPIG
jgi:diacylglycerol O-acyltransferase / wax synthase